MTANKIAPFVAIAALVGYAAFVFVMLGRTSELELAWTRDLYLLSGVEAVALAGAGFVFGKEVHRQQAEAAQARAEDAEQKADQSEQKAITAERNAYEAAKLAEVTRVRADDLTKLIKVKSAARRQTTSLRRDAGATEFGQVADDLMEIENFANALLPESLSNSPRAASTVSD